jgi:S1-C subfamily serine protease
LSPSVFKLVVLSVNKGKEDFASGSAVALTKNLAVTNCHVSAGMDAVAGKIGGELAMFRAVSGNKQKDVCTIRTDQTLQPVTEFRRFSNLQVGEKVYAIGSPQALENTISEGIISGLRTAKGVRYVQTTAAITYGSSGGGLFDEEGRLVGITTKGFKGGGNLNFAVAADEVLEVLDASR